MSDMTVTEIESELEADRQALARSLAALQDRVSTSALISAGREIVSTQAGPILSRVDNAVRSQPLIAAVAGVAMVALVLGRKSGQDAKEPTLAGSQFEAVSRWEDEGGPPAPDQPDPDQDWLHEAVGLRQKAVSLLTRIDDAARRGVAPVAELAAHRAAVTAALARDTAQVMGKGLEGMAQSARQQALQARERIYLSRLSVMSRGQDLIETQPVATGLAVAVAGAALACLFPPTETEDRFLGEARDRMVSDLKHALRKEALQVSAVARTLKTAVETDLSRIGNVLAPVPPVTDTGPGAWRH